MPTSFCFPSFLFSRLEVDISIVNPSKQLFTFKHSTDQGINEFSDEVRVGGSLKEFEFYDDSIKGDWQFLTEFKFKNSTSSIIINLD